MSDDYTCPTCGARLSSPWWLLVSCPHEDEHDEPADGDATLGACS